MLNDLRRWGHRYQFTILLVSILAMALVPVLTADQDATTGLVEPDDQLNGLLWGVVLIAAVHAVSDRPRHAVFFSLGALVVFGGRLASVFGPRYSMQDPIDAGSLATAALFLFMTIFMVYREIIRGGHVHLDTVMGAICVYLLIGYAWANIYALIWFVDPGAFNFPAHMTMTEGSLIPEFTFGYYSFVTLTTLGYGDITPISYAARTLSWLEAVVGVSFMATVIAFMVSQVVADRAAGRQI